MDSAALPVIEGALELAEQGHVTRGDRENRAYIGNALQFGASVPEGRQSVMLDPQTSGGLAIFVAEDRVDELVNALESEGAICAAALGRAVAGETRLRVS
jgi:selenide,water dikinase